MELFNLRQVKFSSSHDTASKSMDNGNPGFSDLCLMMFLT